MIINYIITWIHRWWHGNMLNKEQNWNSDRNMKKWFGQNIIIIHPHMSKIIKIFEEKSKCT